jgi:group II intron reverse transcriptase/maturase
MQKAETILAILNQKSKQNSNFIFDRVYRNLFNYNFFIEAYQNIYSKEGNMTPGTDGETIDGFRKSKIYNLIELLKDEQYYPNPVRRTYIQKKNSTKQRPLGIPSFTDKLLYEVVRRILDAIYEPTFSDNSHGFRPHKSCQTALYQVKSTCRGTKWVIEGDITGCFDNIDHEILLQILARKIDDGRLIELIRRFLKAGYFEFKQVHNSLSGVPQGSGASPVLANIYLNELDKCMELQIQKLNKGARKQKNPKYQKIVSTRINCLKDGNYEEAGKLLKELRKIPSQNQTDKNYARVKYTRYADDFVICIDGDKELAEKTKENITIFLKENLKLELNAEKTVITNLKDSRVRFLGYEISKSHEDTKITKNSKGVKKRSINETIQLLVPGEVIRNKIQPFEEKGKPASFPARTNLPILDIIKEYNSEIGGLYNYYCLATDVSTKIGKFRYYHYTSLKKTIARKEKSSVEKIVKKYGLDVPRKQGTGTRKIVGVKYETKEGEKTMTYFNDSLEKVDEPNTNITDKYYTRINRGAQLIKRLNADHCELCGTQEGEFEVHHVRKLKDIKGKYRKLGKVIPNWVLTMSSMNRKTLIVCTNCHDSIHAGKF